MKNFNSLIDKTLSQFNNKHLDLDYLNQDVSCECFDWNAFFEKFHEKYIFESIELPVLVKDEIRKNNSRHLEYLFSVNNFSFLSVVDAIQCKHELDSLRENIIKHQMQKIETSLIEKLRDVYAKNPDKFVLKYQFKDQNGNTLMSNKLENLAFAVLRCALKAFMASMKKIEIENVICIEMHVAKSEYKRLDLYRKLIHQNKAMDDTFKHEYVDSTSDMKYVTYYRWK